MIVCSPTFAGDWPQLGFDAQHSSNSPEELPRAMAVRWAVQLPELKPAWPDQSRLRNDSLYQPLIVDGKVIVASSMDDSVVAYDVRDGGEVWRFYTGGPIRVAPAADGGRIFVGSDDGWMYALEARSGAVSWKMKGAPRSRPVIGNERLIDTWPIRGGPVVEGGRVYFAAGIWPFMGIFLHCVDAKSGKVIWTNSGDGSAYLTQPHGAPSFAGIAPQGNLVVMGNKLLVPNGRSLPACYDKKTGRMIYFQLNNKFGGDNVVVAKDWFFTGDMGFDLTNGKPAAYVTPNPVIDGGMAYVAVKEGIAGYSLSCLAWPERDSKFPTIGFVSGVATPAIRNGKTLIRAGSRLYAGGKGFVAAMDLPFAPENPDGAWRVDVDGVVVSLAAGAGAIVAVCEDGGIYCLGDAKLGAAKSQPDEKREERFVEAGAGEMARAILADSKMEGGYCLVLGASGEGVAREIVKRSGMRVVMLEGNAGKVLDLRKRLGREGIYGGKIAVVEGRLAGAKLPPYFASVAVASDSSLLRGDDLAILYRSLHPYHGRAYFKADAAVARRFEAGGASVSTVESMVCLRRSGGLAGAGNWTHEHADASNTRVSADSLVKAPLGILWFGGSSNDGMLPRHGHGPQPQVIDGRAIVEGVDKIRAMDIYTGRVLWEKSVPGVGSYFNNTAHQAGANGTGSNYVSLADGIYVVMDRVCLRLDPGNGEEIGRFELPTELLAGSDSVWGYLNVEGDYLIGGWAKRGLAAIAAAKTQEKVDPDEEPEDKAAKRLPATNPRTVGSKGLFVMDRRSGKVLWSVNALKLFRHNAICIGGGRLYAIDTNPVPALFERDKPVPGPSGMLRVFDLASGNVLWDTSDNVSGTWLSYSREYDVLVEAGRKARDTLRDEPKGMRAYKGASGDVLWFDREASGPAMIRGKMVLKESSAADLVSGEPLTRNDPITGFLAEWTWSRQYGCNTPVASQNLLTFRSGAAGFYDLARFGGTGNFGGFRSSCTNNLIVAGGVLVAPDYTRTCTCSYQMQTSLALYSDAEAEMWTYTGANNEAAEHVQRVGINLGAPGDRVDDAGTLWVEYPSVGGKSPAVKVAAAGEKMEFFRRHASVVSGPMPWVTASGAKNIKSLKVTLNADGVEFAPYLVRLYFAQPGAAKAGENVFDVVINGRIVEKGLDVVKLAGGADRSLVREYENIEAGGEMMIELKAKKGATVLCGAEIIAEKLMDREKKESAIGG